MVALRVIGIFAKLDFVSRRQQSSSRLLPIVIAVLEVSKLIEVVEARQPWERISERLIDHE